MLSSDSVVVEIGAGAGSSGACSGAIHEKSAIPTDPTIIPDTKIFAAINFIGSSILHSYNKSIVKELADFLSDTINKLSRHSTHFRGSHHN